VNYAPIFQSPLGQVQLRVSESELIEKSALVVSYQSPVSIDAENDTISISQLTPIHHYPFLNLTLNQTHGTFILTLDPYRVDKAVNQTIPLVFRLEDDSLISHYNEFVLPVEVLYLPLNQFYDFIIPFNDYEAIRGKLKFESFNFFCPNITHTNSTEVRNMCEDLNHALSNRFID
jgi:hypothetical protein